MPEILFTPTSLKRTEVFCHLLWLFYELPSSFCEQFLSHQCALVPAVGEFLLVHDSSFHHGAEMGPRGGLGSALRWSRADQLRLGAHMRGHKTTALHDF